MRFRIRFGLKTLLVTTTVFAVFFGVVERRARLQRTFKEAISSMNGNTTLAPIFPSQPAIITKLFGEDRTMSVVAVKVVGYRAPNLELDSDSRPYALVSRQSMLALIKHPAMESVEDLEIIGTSVAPDAVTPLCRLQQLDRLQLTSSMLRADDMDSLRAALPGCEVDGSSMAHTVHWLRQEFPESELPDLAVFSRARDGDAEAIEALSALASKRYLGRIIPRILDAANAPTRESATGPNHTVTHVLPPRASR